MSQRSVTDTRHNDYVGGEASRYRIPGADKATSGHFFVSVVPKEGPDTQNPPQDVRRPDEILPPPTGRDRPPRGINEPIAPAEQGSFTERLTTVRSQDQPQPLQPAPDSRTVVDSDPFAEPTTAGDTLTGATSQDVYRGIGKPAGGMSSKELHHDGHTHRKRNLQGTDQYGTASKLNPGDETNPWPAEESE